MLRSHTRHHHRKTAGIPDASSSLPIINTTHLVSDQGDGQFRWFFDPGTADNINQTGSCDLVF